MKSTIILLLLALVLAGCRARASNNDGVPVAQAGGNVIYLVTLPAGCFLVVNAYSGADIIGPVRCWSP